jgi:hypothetical protein
VLGAATIYWLRDVVWANFLDYHLIVEGLLLITIVLFVPEGIMGSFGNKSGTSIGRLWVKYINPTTDSSPQAEVSP